MHLASARRGARRRPGRASRPRAPRRRCPAASSSASTTAAPVTRSSWPVGSSARISRGRPASARATATRCAWPPEISSGSFVGELGEAEPRRAPPARAARASASVLAGEDQRQRDVLRDGQRRQQARALEDDATGRAAAPVPSPGQVTLPRVGRSSPAIRCSSVDLPEPDGPTSAMRAPARDLAVGRLEARRSPCAPLAERAARRPRSARAARSCRHAGRRAAGSRGPAWPRPPASWVTTTTAMPSSARSRSSPRTRAAVASSSSPVGSSASSDRAGRWPARRRGRRGRARRRRAARAARGRAPAMPQRSSTSSAGARPSPPPSRCASAMLSATVRWPTRFAVLEQHPDAARAQPRPLLLGAAREPLAVDAAPCRRRARRGRPGRRAASTCPSRTGPVTATSSPALDGERHALQRERLVVAGVEEAVQAARPRGRRSSRPPAASR